MKAILGEIVSAQQIRGCDSAGCGNFGASRKRKVGGVSKSVQGAHTGIDVITTSGESVKSPIEGTVVKIGRAYSDDKRFLSFHIQGKKGTCYEGVRVKILYMKSLPTVSVSDEVVRGQPIGTAQNLRLKYKSITNHIHFEVKFNGVKKDPTNLFGASACGGRESIEFIPTQDEPEVNVEGKRDQGVLSYRHVSAESSFIEDLLEGDEFKNVVTTKEKLLSTEHQGRTNHLRLYEGLSLREKKRLNDGDSTYNESVDYPISEGVEIFFRVADVKIERSYESNITVTKKSANQYFAPILRELTNDPGYVPAINNRGLDAKDIHPQLTVWIWSRNKYLESGGDSGFMDITKDVISCTTGSTLGDGGNFNIELPPIIARLIEDDETSKSSWTKEDSIDYGDDSVSLGNVNRERIYKSKQGVGSELLRNDLYYNRVLQQNDLVFISFEKLEIEGELAFSQVEGRWYDMIGLIDVVTTSSSGPSNESSIGIRGRDLFKVPSDDNSYFNPYSVGHANSLYGGQFGSRFLQGEFKDLSAILPRSIKDSLEFIFHRIASIGYVPDDIFGGFQNKTEITTTIKGGDKNEEKSVKGIWQLIKIFIDQSIEDLRLVDDSVSNPNGSLVDIIRKVAQEPFVEFFGDTYGDKYYFTFRQPPFTFNAISEIVWNIDNVDEDFSSFKQEQQTPIGGATSDQNNKYNDREAKKQEQRQDRDEKTNLFIKEENDTAFESIGLSEVSIVASEVFPKIININEDDVIVDSLQYSTESYAWYKLTERGNFAGNTVNLGHVPAIYFDEYAQVFGNKILDITSNYSDYNFFRHKDSDKDVDLYAQQASQLLSFLVETNAYLPFTRQGSITLNGDRRIKKGQWIYYRPTQEIFYVKGVDNNIVISESQIDRTTTLTVERGMVKSYIKDRIVTVTDENGVDKQIEVSYFKIVDIQNLKDGIYDTIAKGSVSDKFNHKANMALNTDVFNFFLQRRQHKPKKGYE